MRLNIKPLSVNECWQGRRFKTKKYLAYEKELLLMLKPLKLPQGNLFLNIKFGFSNKNSDIDNCVKPLLDILQKKYSFNDRNIYRLCLEKTIVKRGYEFIEVEFY
jgi:Holliday junction resolvase RusA-like endonuclease